MKLDEEVSRIENKFKKMKVKNNGEAAYKK